MNGSLSIVLRTVACVVALAVTAPLPPVVAQTGEPVIRVASGPDDPGTPLMYAAKAGLYAKYGLNVEVVKLGGAAAVAAALAGGSLEIGKGSTLGVVTAIGKGLPFTVIGNMSYYDSRKPDLALLVAANSPITRPKDLEGKTFAAVTLQDMNSVATYAWLDAHGVEASKIKYVEMPASVTLDAIEHNRVDASTVYEPYFSMFVASGKVRVLAYPYDAIAKRFSDSLLFANTKWAGEHRDVVDRFLRATQEASTYISAHENESIPLIAEFGGADPASIKSLHHPDRGVPINPADIQPVIDAAAKYKVIPRAFPASDMLCPCAMRK